MDTNVAAALEARILREIPLARAMQLAVTDYSGATLELAAPLAPNGNDKGCAFGGSLTALMTLAGWGLIELGLRAQELECDIYVGDSHLRYHEPVWNELCGIARFAEHGALPRLVTAVRERGRGHAEVVCEIVGKRRAAVTLAARFFAKLRK